MIEFQGNAYENGKALCKAFNVAQTTFIGRLKRGLTMRQALGIDPYRVSYAGWGKDDVLINGEPVEGATYRLYEIINLANHKSYVGITIQSLSKRYAHHIYDAKCNKPHPLYNAIRKYGIENFEIRLIREDAKSGAELQQQEIDEIARRNSTSREHGYNLHSGGTSGHKKRFVIGDKVFPSLHEAALHFCIEPATFCKRIREGHTPEHAAGLKSLANIRGHWVIVDGIKMNLMDAVMLLNKSYRTVSSRIHRGWTYRQAVDLDPPPARLGRNKRPLVIHTDHERDLGVSPSHHYGLI